MAALSITASAVLKGSGATVATGLAGATITQGQSVYFDTATSTWKLALGGAGTAEQAGASGVGIALNAASANQPLSVLTQGPLTINSAATVGTSYYLGDNAGEIVPSTDVGTGDRVTYLGTATLATVLAIQPHVTGIAKP